MKITAQAALLAFVLICPGTAGAQEQPVEAPDWGDRYAVVAMKDGFVRIDRQTGALSRCEARNGDVWTCRMIAEDRQALEDEIARLKHENDRLGARLKALGEAATLPETIPDTAPDAQIAPDAGTDPDAGQTPEILSDEELERFMDQAEGMMRRFFDRIEEFRRERERAGTH